LSKQTEQNINQKISENQARNGSGNQTDFGDCFLHIALMTIVSAARQTVGHPVSTAN
jgi:hypothetical protein